MKQSKHAGFLIPLTKMSQSREGLILEYKFLRKSLKVVKIDCHACSH